ncbi:MAG: DUF362 domain-containing protein [Actinomycetota bacterium]
MASKVYFAEAGGRPRQGPLDRLHMLFEAAGFPARIAKRDLVAVKVHVGERGSTSFVPPYYVSAIVEDVTRCGGRPFLTDSGCLYFSARYNARDHMVVAAEHGFTIETAGAPFLVADGLRGSDVRTVDVGYKNLASVDVVSAIHDANSLVVVTHVTGHALTGFAGTLKNLGMGAAGRRMKLAVHDQVRPGVKHELCTVCNNCLDNCPAEAVDIVDGQIVMDPDVCIGCGECISICPEKAVGVLWKGDPLAAQEKLAEISAAVLANKHDRCCFFTFLINVTPTCDCWNYSAAPLVGDIGYLASTDPVAIDQAAADLVNGAERAEGGPGNTDRFKAFQGIDWSRQLSYAEEIGLGTRAYELERIGD